MTRGAPSQRYGVARTKDGGVFVITKASLQILATAQEHPEITYDELLEVVDYPRQSLVVFVSRLERAGLAKRGRMVLDGRQVATVSVTKGVKLHLEARHI